jgi:hypothetical protein
MMSINNEQVQSNFKVPLHYFPEEKEKLQNMSVWPTFKQKAQKRNCAAAFLQSLCQIM